MINNNSQSMRVRFAPSPTGYLHLGGVRTAIFCWALAKHYNGKFILRIEDTDTERSTQAAVEAILDSLKWLDINPDEGPYYQMQRIERYNEVINQMLNEGTAYYCYSSQEDIEFMRNIAKDKGLKPKYDYTWRPEIGKNLPTIPKDKKPVVRFKNNKIGITEWEDIIKGHISFNNDELDDFVLVRSNGIPTYNFCVVVDDLDMNITHILRGEDHINNTPKQLNLIKALKKIPPKYGHIPMILGSDNKKLSKRHGDISLLEYKKNGYLPEAIINYLARLGWSHGDSEIFSRTELIKWFDISKISKSSAKWDLKKLKWINAHYIKHSNNNRLKELILPYLIEKGFNITICNLDEIIELLKNRSDTILDMANQASIFYEEVNIKNLNFNKNTMNYIQDFYHQLHNIEWNKNQISNVIKFLVNKHHINMFELCYPIRLAITGREKTPSIDSLLAILGKQKVLSRLEKFIKNNS
ncbi:Glutamate--tRNA ligase [Candidatus Kinetoplastibacterium sorsogonicusi]|uniref:Glutamate--tRNA ligase n=1 Tax=Candidatus Kinetoplastidibacterium kentomonadis TaxID=1576550 RepID=A0A3Q8EUI3_9PROT|nr:glutamate--tRNA ligase [Candidatus Kinetoplastibacterium sorsogonicusi]AWD32693.1 Glutamate--tRNA ligase [Candidatus Kinetoplastibacterium sorsogonicusi]